MHVLEKFLIHRVCFCPGKPETTHKFLYTPKALAVFLASQGNDLFPTSHRYIYRDVKRESGDAIVLRIAQIQRCIQVAVFRVAACGANIDAIFEFQAVMHMPTGVAGLGTRVEAVRDAEFNSDDLCLAPQILTEGIKALLCHGLREMAVLHHAGHVEVFHRDEAWFLLHQCVDDLILVIAAEIRQPLMQSLYR